MWRADATPWPCVWLALLLLLGSGTLFADQPRITLSAGDWPPFIDRQLPAGGPLRQIIDEAFASQGLQVDWHFYPWARALHQARQGRVQGSVLWSRTSDRERDFLFSDVLMHNRVLLVERRQANLHWQTLADLQHARLAGVVAYDYGHAFQRLERQGQLQVLRLPDETQGLRMLIAGRLDAMPMEEAVARHLLGKLPREQQATVRLAPRPLREDGLFVLFNRQDPQALYWRDRFNRGLQQLGESGRLAVLLSPLQTPADASR